MANHCYYHFEQKISLEEVEEAIHFFCKERLGDENLVRVEEDVIYVKIPVDIGLESYASFWLKNNKTLEHRHPHFGFEYGVKIAEFAAWRLKSTHGTDEGIEEKISPHNFLSKPLIRFDSLLDVFHESLPLKIIKKMTPKIKSKYMDEEHFLNSVSKNSAFYYQGIYSKEPYAVEMTKKYIARLEKIVSHLSQDTGDAFYGNAIRAALSNSNYKLAADLIDNGFEVKDHIELTQFKKPDYISDLYLQEIAMPLISLGLSAMNSKSNPVEIYKVIAKLIQHGADPTIKDSRGLDSLDILFLNKTQTKNNNAVIFQAFSENMESKILRQKILESSLSDLKKDTYLSCLKTFNSKISKIK